MGCYSRDKVEYMNVIDGMFMTVFTHVSSEQTLASL